MVTDTETEPTDRPECHWHKGAPLSQDERGAWECYFCEAAISDFIDNNAYGEKLDLLTTRNALITGIQILHRKEISPRARGNLLLKDPETATEKRLVMGYRAQKEMRKSVSRFLQKTKAGFIGRNMEFFRYSEDRPFEEHVMEFFTSSGRSAGS